MFIGQGLSLEARHAAQAERRAANTATAAASAAAAAAAADSTAAATADSTAAAAVTERASSASLPFFALSPPAEMVSVASPLVLVYAEDFYLEHNRSVRALLILCHGLTHDDGTPAINVLALPWSTMKKSTIRVSSKDYQSEITRRWDIMCAYDPDLKANFRDIPRPNQWKLAKLQMWLDDNPVTDDGERAFLLAAVDERIGASARAEAEKAAVVSALFNKKWVGKVPIIRLIHALVDNDEIKHAYIERFDVPSDRMVIENRNTPETRAACCWAMMAVKWNDPLFSPSSILMRELHSDFGGPIVIDHDVISDLTVATAEKVRDKWSGLLHGLKRQIEKWERSGQGDGGYYIDDDAAFGDDKDETRPAPKFGELSNRSQGALDSRAAFFRYKESYLLYLWEVLECNGLLVSSMQRLNGLAAAANGADGIPSVVGAVKPGDDSSVTTADHGDKHSNTQKIKDLSKTINDHGKKMVSVAKMKCNQREKDRNEREKDRSYAMQAEIRASLRSLGAEKRQMTIQMQAEKVKKISQWKLSMRMQLPRSKKRRSRRFRF
jgi:hypothetical protein